jgi:hypothetical protein
MPILLLVLMPFAMVFVSAAVVLCTVDLAYADDEPLHYIPSNGDIDRTD